MGNENSIFKHPKKQMILVVLIAIIWYLYLVYRIEFPSLTDLQTALVVTIFFRFDLIPESVGGILFDLFLFGLNFMIWLAFFAQFVLPLHSGRERLSAVSRLLTYVFGRHGPAVTIQDGEVKQRKKEIERKGPGVILLDTASAAVLRSPIEFTRAVGPGTVFTAANESIAGVVDLHQQSRFIGPRRDEKPFLPIDEEETDQEYRNRQERRWETSGLTRDGVEVVPNISVVFRLDGTPGIGGTEFGYNAASVRKAIAHEGIDPTKARDTTQRNITWRWLPAYMGADLWREYLRKFTLNELFEERQGVTAFETIQRYVNDRMTKPATPNLDELGRRTGPRRIMSREYKVLQNRGLKVLSCSVSNLRFPASVEDNLIHQWRANWLEQAKDQEKIVSQQRSYARHEGERIALMNFSESASRLLGNYLVQKAATAAQAPGPSLTLELLVRGSLDQCIKDSALLPHLTNEKADLIDLVEWIRRN